MPNGKLQATALMAVAAIMSLPTLAQQANIDKLKQMKVSGTDPNIPVQSYVYLPAPSAGTSVTLDAGPFGRIDNLPVE
jgi:hypothetical protein